MIVNFFYIKSLMQKKYPDSNPAILIFKHIKMGISKLLGLWMDALCVQYLSDPSNKVTTRLWIILIVDVIIMFLLLLNVFKLIKSSPDKR